MRGEAALIDLSLENPDGDATESLRTLKQITDQMVVRTTRLPLQRCGFSARAHHWQCPSCKHWGSDQAPAHRGRRLMDAWQQAAALAAAGAVGCAFLTAAWTALARRRQWQDLPGERRLHAVPTPRGGGIAIAIVFCAALLWLDASFAPAADWPRGLALGVGAFALVGLVDDLRPLPGPAKLALQFLAGIALLACSGHEFAAQAAVGAALLVALVYFVNIWNFMDGSNGLVTIQALLVALALAFWPGQDPGLSLAAIALAAACLGFLPFNFPRARVFLGDVGSLAMGAAVFGLLWLSWRQGSLGLGPALLLVAVMLLDSGLTLARRLAAGRSIWQAHREHLYQLAIRRGNSHASLAFGYGAATLAAILAALALRGIHSSGVVALLLIVAGIGAALLHGGLRRHWLRPDAGQGVQG